MKKILFLFLILISCNNGAINDIDGNSYELTKIGNQEWFTKNLNVSKFRNGEAILEAKNKEDWMMYGEKGIPAFCYYNFDKANESKYGKLYNWYAVTDVRGLAPEGYHIPDDNDWEELTLILGDKLESQNKTRSKTGWKKNGNNITGFKGLPAGGIDEKGEFFNIGTSGYWWTSTGEDAKYDTWYRPLERFDDIFGAYESHAFGYSVRCIKNKNGVKKNAKITNKLDIKTEIMTYSTTECGDLCGHYFIDSKGVEKQILLPDNCEYEFIEGNDNQYKGKKFKITSKSINNSSEDIVLKVEMITNNINTEENQANNSQGKSFNDIQLTLMDGSLKKAKLYLGEPDKYEFGFGHVTKGFAVYYNRVTNQNGTPKHLVLFLRMDNGGQWGNDAKIEEIYSVDDNQKACFGIHCIMINNKTISTNALDLIHSKGYKSIY